MSTYLSQTAQFSIIIPVLNEAATIEQTLGALQSLRPFAEIIVVDGGSQDDTLAKAKGLADCLLQSLPGRARQMNMGAQQAQGEIFIFLHADTFLPDNALKLIAEQRQSHPLWGRFDIQLIGQHPFLPVIAFCMNWRSRLSGIATGDQAIFVQRNAFQQVKQYTDLALMEDIDLCRKLKALAPPICLRAKVRSSARRWEQFGVFKTILLMWSLRLRYFFGASPDCLASLYRQGHLWKQ